MATPASIPTNCSRDSVQRIHRITRENRSLWYQLTVLQQPERARACGSGMKANSDRRPVDPPPVVELRIIEGPSVDEGKDITFDYNANFFLYASLEQARNVAHGRVQTPAASNPPILTGVPASGMAYLDRPAEAGYFIFPDLSVRHEGYFRLSFSLFETTKEEKDFDLEPADSDLPPGVDWRMEIKTHPFNVYSAKKFPGLMESTQLSKTVADQGCRVRIRRDVRMRKRDGKSNGYERRDDEYSRRRTVTPASEDPHGIRPRSLSNSSEPRVQYGGDATRRPSAVDPYPPPPPPPGYEAAPPPSRGHLSFGDAPPPQYAAPRHYPQAGISAPPVSPGGPYPSAQSPYGYHHDGHSRRDSHTSFNSTPSLPPPAQRTKPIKPHASLAPLKIASLVSPLPPIEAQAEPLPAPPVVFTGGKRKHEIVFHQNAQPLHNGRRQLDPHFGGRTGATSDPGQGMYSRADGKVGVVTFSQWQ
ncbi:velvet factor domain-containing protein [Hirsutella rhossiliensis]|uniref:Velvet factor domain-containing protein n=1 Tax=Hirsutella rhossiliensis TaxID=111463 RepID=A0A9P8N4I7_9HYPO|nr:velvet factor domain-containing protein [Hirsutella rhossiliensis]KAH0966472.1 velvet factor domain-containing protein [Hirsutella rhossiliensis]